MTRRDNNDMNPIERDRYERRMAVRRKSMFTNIIVRVVIVAVVAAIVVVAVNMLNKPKTADTAATTAETTATIAGSSAPTSSTTAQEPAQANNNAVQQPAQNSNQQNNQAQQQTSTDVQLTPQNSVQASEQYDNGSVEEINGDRVYVDNKHKSPENTGTADHYYTYGSSAEGGFNWNYDADNSNFVVSCNYNFNQQQYDFSFYGSSPGTSNVTLYYYDSNGQWVSTYLTVNVDENLNVSVG